MLSAAAATSILSLSGAHAFAASGANGQAQDSPGFLSGNTVQAPVDVPVNACGNTADVVGVGNPASGNKCASSSHSHASSSRQGGGPEATSHAGGHSTGAGADAIATGESTRSSGVLSGNTVQAPVAAPVNLCGNSVNAVGALNPAAGNSCANEAPHHEPPAGHTPPAKPKDPAPRAKEPVHPEAPKPAKVAPEEAPEHGPRGKDAPRQDHADMPDAQLAATGADPALFGTAAASAGLLLGGAILYRRRRASSRH